GIRDFHVTGVQTCALPILGDLISGSVDMAEAATKAQDIKSKLDTQLDKQQRDQAVALAQNQTGLEKARLEAERAKAAQVTPAEAQHASNGANNQAAKGNISKDEARQVVRNEVFGMKGAQPASLPMIKVQFYFKHGKSKQFLDGNFSVTIEGPS